MVEEDNQTRLMADICNSLKLFKESIRKPSLLPISPSPHGGWGIFEFSLCSLWLKYQSHRPSILHRGVIVTIIYDKNIAWAWNFCDMLF